MAAMGPSHFLYILGSVDDCAILRGVSIPKMHPSEEGCQEL